jgi:hypothetical protein
VYREEGGGKEESEGRKKRSGEEKVKMKRRGRSGKSPACFPLVAWLELYGVGMG